jgi:hypothetical protein
MPKPTANFDTIRKIGLALPGVEEGVAWGTPVLKVHGKIFAGIAIHSSAEPGSLMVRMAPEDRDELISAAPEVYYVTDHYIQGSVLVRLSRVNADVLRDLIGMSHKYVLASVVGSSRYPKPEKVRRKKGSRRG